MNKLPVILWLVLFSTDALSQRNSFPLSTTDGLLPVQVAVKPETYLGKLSTRVWDTSGVDFDKKFAKLKSIQIHNGSIEVELAGRPLPTAGEGARGFVGVAFRISEKDEEFECIYLRPTNGRTDDQVRRNHSVQYISHPGYPWYKLRKDAPEKYESYVDLEVGKWTKVKIEVQDSVAKLYVHGATQPTLIVNGLMLGANKKGSIGLWIGPGTDAHFRNLVVTKKD